MSTIASLSDSCLIAALCGDSRLFPLTREPPRESVSVVPAKANAHDVCRRATRPRRSTPAEGIGFDSYAAGHSGLEFLFRKPRDQMPKCRCAPASDHVFR